MKSARNSSASARRARASESFSNAHECIGEITPKMALFAITRGQFSMIDAILACLDQTGPAEISLWTWTIAEYEVQCMERLRIDSRLTAGKLIIDHGARSKNTALLRQWQSTFGASSVRYVVNHAKIATIESDRFKLLLRGSMNLNFNPRFEQFDITEGGADFDLVKSIEDELPVLPDNASGAQVYEATQLSNAYTPDQISIFSGPKVWGK